MDLARAADTLRLLLAQAHSPKDVHSARKLLKRLRAHVRLVRGTLGKKRFARLNRTLREAGRALSAVRDAAVLVQTFDSLASEAPPLSSHARRVLLRRQQDGHAASLMALRTVSRLGPLPAPDLGTPKTWKRGLRRTYRDGRRALREARAEWCAEHAHELRKRAKDLRYELEALGADASELERLGDLLGRDHDLVVLQATLRAHGHRGWDALLAKQRKHLKQQAVPLAKQLYAEAPRRFVAGLKSGQSVRAGSPA